MKLSEWVRYGTSKFTNEKKKDNSYTISYKNIQIYLQ